jgi:hypothetical protein
MNIELREASRAIWVMIVVLSAFVLTAGTDGKKSAPKSANTAPKPAIRCEGVYPFHLQGVATDGTNIFWSFTTVLAKTDLAGKVLAKSEITRAEGHLGDLCCHDGKVYVGVGVGRRDESNFCDHVWEYDIETMKLIKKYPTPEAVWRTNGIEFYAGSFWVISSTPQYCQYNMVTRYTPDFKFMRCQMIDSGWTNVGVQTICLWGDKMLFGCYGTTPGKGDKFPHKSCTFVVDGKALSFAGDSSESPHIVPCERRVDVNTAEGMLVLNGTLWRARGVRLPPSPNEKGQRWRAQLIPCTLK